MPPKIARHQGNGLEKFPGRQGHAILMTADAVMDLETTITRTRALEKFMTISSVIVGVG